MSYAIITGAGSGIGKAVATQLLHNGFNIAVCGRDKARLELAQQEWKEAFPAANVLIYTADISIAASATAFVAEVTSVFPEIDVLVNNAGTFLPGDIADEPEGRLEALMATNLYSAYYITRSVLPIMKAQKRGHVFNMCSVASLKAYPNGGAYSITKYALLGFSDNLREEVRPHGIKVTSICPGATYTPSWEGSGVQPERIMEARDVALTIAAAAQLSPAANVEHIVMRPLLGDL
ncbi:MAG: SDR family NAD(P)-dependent oxidoreductase [Chitinophagia bacterium]|nr:SDR family NAD(P)-dependent oxidoreductase [Chitinophagia bacterium]